MPHMIFMRIVKIVLISTLPFSVSVAIARAQENQSIHENQATSERRECPDGHPYTGRYENYNYYFSIVIPEGLRGFWNSVPCASGSDGCVCMQDHGQFIPLDSHPNEYERYIEVYSGYASEFDHPTVSLEVKQRLKRIRRQSPGHEVSIRNRSKILVAGLTGERLVVRYYDEKLNRQFVDDFVEMLRGDVEYSLYLRTTENSYRGDRATFDSVIASFKLTK